jgi:methanethiol S-methyltransferase
VQHTVIARPAVKRRWRLNRPTFVLASSLVLGLVFWQWRPVPEVVWDLGPEPLRVVVWAVYLAGWLLVIAMTFAFGHAEFLGLKQPAGRPRLRLPGPYRLVRHPMMTGFLIAFWVTPTMTAGHLLFAALGTAYILVGVRFEERALVRDLPGYAEYAARTPRFLPHLTNRHARG